MNKKGKLEMKKGKKAEISLKAMRNSPCPLRLCASVRDYFTVSLLEGITNEE